jgi:hypothetical protein
MRATVSAPNPHGCAPVCPARCQPSRENRHRKLWWELPALRVPALLIARVEMRASPRVKEVRPDQIGTALRRLAADLVAERRRVVQLERENRELRAQLEELRGPAAAAAPVPRPEPAEPEQRPSAV